jgi:hypothetical protein
VCLEEELHALVAAVVAPVQSFSGRRDTTIVLRHSGFDGAGGTTLQELGHTYGLTRERVRQICFHAYGALKRLDLSTPLLDRALAFVASQLPAVAETLEARLKTEGYTTQTFRLEGLAQAARLLGRSITFEVKEISKTRTATGPKESDLIHTVLKVVRQEVARFGVASLPAVEARVRENHRDLVAAEFVKVLHAQRRFEWLDQNLRWFWLGSTSTKLASRIRRMIAVAGRLDVSKLRQGIMREQRMQGFAMPCHALLELCRRLPFCRVKETYIQAQVKTSWRKAVSGVEGMLVEILKKHGPIMHRSNLQEMCCSGRGLGFGTFKTYLHESPVIEQFAPCVYGLRGARWDAHTMEVLAPHFEPATTLEPDHGWTADNRIWLGIRLSGGILRSGTFGIPGELHASLKGSFSLRSADGSPMGTLEIINKTGKGLRVLFDRRGIEPDDTLAIVFAPKAHAAKVTTIGKESLLNWNQLASTLAAAASIPEKKK